MRAPRPPRAVTPAAFVSGIVAAYDKYGLSPRQALDRAQISPKIVKSKNTRVTAAQFETLANHAMRELDDEALGWFSRRLPWGTYGMLCRASIAAPDLDVALKLWRRHHRLLTADILIDLQYDGDAAILSIDERCDLGSAREFCLVTLLRYVLGFSCWAIDSAITLRHASFPYPEPEHLSAYPTIFCNDVRFNYRRAAIAFDRSYLSLPILRNAADLDRMLKGALRLTVLPYRKDRLLLDRVLRLLDTPRGPMLHADDIARELAVSPRTLHRRLRDEATSLRDLQGQARLGFAARELVRSRAPIGRIAELAGFSNSKSFSRAFRTWTGFSPRAYRDNRRAIQSAS